MAFVVAGAGARVAKHGNRSISSQCGSADLLEAMGVRIPMSPADCARAIREIGIGFLFAPAIHTATRHAHPVRVELKMRTVFNLLGPLTNPAGASAQLAGAPSAHFAELIAGALAALGLERGFVVHGYDGLDEITTTGPTLAFEIRRGDVARRTLTPDDFGVPFAQPEDLKGGNRERNLAIAREILEGARGPQRDIVLVNASAALSGRGPGRRFPGRSGVGGRGHRYRRRPGESGSLSPFHPPGGRDLSRWWGRLEACAGLVGPPLQPCSAASEVRPRRGTLTRAYITPECRFRICGKFCENADFAITMSQPALCAACFNSPCTCDR